jgi:hypothetical protein
VDLLDAPKITLVAADSIRETEVMPLGDEHGQTPELGELTQQAILVSPTACRRWPRAG